MSKISDIPAKSIDEKQKGVGPFVPALILMAIMLVFGAIGLSEAPAQGEMAVVFAPFQPEQKYVSRIIKSGAQYISPSRFHNVIVVNVDSAAVRESLRQQGALFFVNAGGLCAPVV